MRYAAAQLACGVESGFVRSFWQDYRELLAPDARDPIDAAPKILLQPRPELSKDLIAAAVTEGIVDLLEEVDVAQNQRQRPAIARGSVDFTREMLAEESPAGHARQIICGRKLAILGQRDANDALQLGDPAR